ncbi:hypothetical protein B0H16DRAFT_1530254 [Mycena metata]|uniref:Uncharacterized protein n=1 Tax=Mycena metata TaxID=1033252 RepID=A0AAD7JCP4_9AGAR|nr:hypothetical protein B0H16DRAFT_1530254 [Mycena metata]
MVFDTPSISPPAAISLCFVAILYGMHLLVFPAAVYVLSRKQLTKSILVMLAAVLFMFCTSTILTVTLFTATILDGTLDGIYLSEHVRSRILMWPRSLNLIVADAIVVWRMTVLYPNKVVRGGIFFFLFLFSAISLFNSAALKADAGFSPELGFSAIASFLSFGTNFMATAAISWKAWTYRRQYPQAWRGSQTSNAVNNAFILLIETGILYLLWQLLVAVVSWEAGTCNLRGPLTTSCLSLRFASNAIVESTTIVAALYLSLTVVIVGLKKSIADKCGPLPSAKV